jgi:hypothetical protein
MKNITESLNDIQGLTPYLKGEEPLNEGLKDVLKKVKEKFNQVFTYLKGVVARFGTYFLGTNEKGEIVNAISPLTSGAAYANGEINKKSTLVVMDKEGAKITGCKTKPEDAKKLYGPGNSIKYWDRMVTESEDNVEQEAFATILEYFENYNKEHNIVNEVKLHTEDPEAEDNIIVDDDELKQEIKICLNDHNQARLMIWGAPGIGKTAILMNVLDEMQETYPDYRLIVKTLSNETPDNFTLPKYVDVEGQEFATDVPKTWLPVYKPTGNPMEDKKLSEKCGNGLLFIDELSRATPQVLNVVLPLVNEGIFNGYKLGDGWCIICASNRSQDETSGQSKIGNALANRFAQVYYEPTVKTWRKWADNQKFISPLLLQWLEMPEDEDFAGGKFYYMDPNEDPSALADTTIMCTPRSWTNAMRRLATFHHTGSLEGFNITDIPDRIIRRQLNMFVPKQAVGSFMAFLNVIKGIGDFDKAVHSIWQEGGKGFKLNKKDLNKIALPLAQLIICAHSKSLPTKKEWDNLVNWLVAQNSDQLASYVLDLYTNVFLGSKGLHEKLFGQAFYMQVRIKQVKGDMSKLGTFVSTFADWCNQWGIKLENIPDWSDGLNKLVDKYGASFESAIVDAHRSALG